MYYGSADKVSLTRSGGESTVRNCVEILFQL